MVLAITPYSVMLDTANPNLEFPQHLMMGHKWKRAIFLY